MLNKYIQIFYAPDGTDTEETQEVISKIKLLPEKKSKNLTKALQRLIKIMLSENFSSNCIIDEDNIVSLIDILTFFMGESIKVNNLGLEFDISGPFNFDNYLDYYRQIFEIEVSNEPITDSGKEGTLPSGPFSPFAGGEVEEKPGESHDDEPSNNQIP